MIGRVFNNRYQITERIGIGGMAEVYRAQDNVLGRLVAVKVMLPQYAADPNFTQRFKQEAAAAANLQSPYIVNVYDWGQDEGTYYIVMEFVRGSDLKTAIIERGVINQRKVAEIGSQVCQALSVAHGLDIIHRDIKPQNIMVQPDGNVKVMDFGIARAKNSVMTQTSSVLGTAHYISPEQAQGKDLTATSDIYSLGIVLYESATGRLPFDGPDAVSVAMKQVNDLPVPPREINPDIDPALEAIIMKAIAKNPADRFETAKDMRLALNDYLAGRPVNLGEDFTSAETMVIGGVVPPIGPVADGTAVMPAMGGMNPPSNGSGPRSYSSDNTAGKKSNKKTIAIVIGIIAALAVVGGIAFALMSGGSGDKEIAEVPNVVGVSLDEAKTTLADAGFAVGNIEQEFNDKVASNEVISQDPKGESKQAKGTKINLTVSKGVQEITVPDLSNKTASEAKKELAANGLKYAEGEGEYSDSVEKGRVIRQDIASGTSVSKDTVVTCYLSLGVEGIEVPSVVGLSRDDAIVTLNNAGLRVYTESFTYQESNEPKDTVLDQTPAKGTSLKRDDYVALTLSEGPKPTFSVAVQSNGGGSVTSNVTSVEEGGQAQITIKPESGYEVASVSGLDDVPKSGGTFPVTNIKANVSISVTFQAVTPPNNSGTNGGGTTGGGTSGGGTTGGTGSGGGSATGDTAKS